jgi:chromosome segregation ATPase
MESIETQLKELQEELKTCEVEIANTQGTLQDAQKKMGEANRRRNALTAKITSLQGELSELQANQSAIETERMAVASEISDANKTIDEVMAQLRDKIPPGRPQAIEDAVEAVDDEIDHRKKAVDDVRDKLMEAEKALADAKNQAAGHEQAAANIKGQLKSLPNQSRTVRSQVSTLKNTMRAMAKSGQINDALYAVRELNRPVDELAKLIDPKQEEELVGQLIAHQQATAAGQEEVAKKTAACEQLRRDVAAAQREHQNAMKTRAAAIKAKLAALPEQTEDGQPSSEPEKKPVASSC